MEKDGKIITIGLSPAWDIGCRGRGLDWGRHVTIDDQVVRPAGKALNVSYALARLGVLSIAAGLWGREDVEQMQKAVRQLGGLVRTEMTAVAGRTRQNVTVVDKANCREMHLRRKSELACTSSLRRLGTDLKKLVRRGDTCIFAGAMPGDALLGHVIGLVQGCHDLGAAIVVDTHGPVLKELVDLGLPYLMTPNVGELRELLDREVPDTPAELTAACRPLLGKVGIVLISRGENGAVLVTKDGAWSGRSVGQGTVLSTVGCGDYLLAGFLAGMAQDGDPFAALATGLKLAMARARGWAETRTWAQTEKQIEVTIELV